MKLFNRLLLLILCFLASADSACAMQDDGDAQQQERSAPELAERRARLQARFAELQAQQQERTLQFLAVHAPGQHMHDENQEEESQEQETQKNCLSCKLLLELKPFIELICDQTRPEIQHSYHQECLQQWFNDHRAAPRNCCLCSAPIAAEVLQQLGLGPVTMFDRFLDQLLKELGLDTAANRINARNKTIHVIVLLVSASILESLILGYGNVGINNFDIAYFNEIKDGHLFVPKAMLYVWKRFICLPIMQEFMLCCLSRNALAASSRFRAIVESCDTVAEMLHRPLVERLPVMNQENLRFHRGQFFVGPVLVAMVLSFLYTVYANLA